MLTLPITSSILIMEHQWDKIGDAHRIFSLATLKSYWLEVKIYSFVISMITLLCMITKKKLTKSLVNNIE